MPINYINGVRLHRSVTAALNRVVSRQEYLNKINVFPVPDGDTGTNMAYTLTTIEKGIRDKAYKDIKRMSMVIADSALDGARGNSGAILAQFFVGFADGIKEKVSLTAKEFAQAALHAKDYAYDALTHPREGTILSVIKAWADSLLESCTHSSPRATQSPQLSTDESPFGVPAQSSQSSPLLSAATQPQSLSHESPPHAPAQSCVQSLDESESHTLQLSTRASP